MIELTTQIFSKLNVIGTTLEASNELITENDKTIKLAEIKITPGVWIVRCSVTFSSADGTGSRSCIVGWGTSEQVSQEVAGNPNGWTKINTVDIFFETQNSTVAVLAKQTSGGYLPCSGSVRAVRIK